MTEAKVPTWAQRFRDAVWEAGPDELSQVEALVLLAYADHARGGDTAWVAQARLIQRCKIRSKGTPSRVLAGLVAKGWLELLSAARWHNRQSPTYRLIIPTTPPDGELYGGQAPRSKRKPPRSDDKAPRSVPQSSPSDGAKLPVNRTPLSSEDPQDPREGGATPPAEPGDAPPEEQDPPPLPPGEGKEAAFAAAKKAMKREIRISKWFPSRAELARGLAGPEPNPAYTSAHAVAVADETPPYEFPPPVDEDDHP